MPYDPHFPEPTQKPADPTKRPWELPPPPVKDGHHDGHLSLLWQLGDTYYVSDRFSFRLKIC